MLPCASTDRVRTCWSLLSCCRSSQPVFRVGEKRRYARGACAALAVRLRRGAAAFLSAGSVDSGVQLAMPDASLSRCKRGCKVDGITNVAHCLRSLQPPPRSRRNSMPCQSNPRSAMSFWQRLCTSSSRSAPGCARRTACTSLAKCGAARLARKWCTCLSLGSVRHTPEYANPHTPAPTCCLRALARLWRHSIHLCLWAGRGLICCA